MHPLAHIIGTCVLGHHIISYFHFSGHVSLQYEQMVCEDNQFVIEYDSTFTIEDNPAAEDLPLVELVDNQLPQTLPAAATVEGSQESGRRKRQRQSGSADHISGYSMGEMLTVQKDIRSSLQQLVDTQTRLLDTHVTISNNLQQLVAIFGKTYN